MQIHRHIHRHAKTIYRVTPKFVHGMVVGAFVGIILVTALRADTANALSISSPRDCDTNAVINCGALTISELQKRYGNKGVGAIYHYFGISAQDIKDMSTTAVAGKVYKDGTVKVGGVTVATKAITAGRLYISGSTKVSSGGVTFYKRAPKVSFRPTSLTAFVAMKNGQFQFAILGACGNPVVATPVPKKATPKPAPTPTPTPTPTPEQPVTIPSTTSTQTPPSKPTAIVASAPKELPNTGPGALIIIAALSIIGGYAFHMTHRHVRRKRRARHAAAR